MSEDLAFVRALTGPLPMRTAAEQWAAAGHQCGVYAVWPEESIVFIDGKGGRCCMRQADWEAYHELCAAPTISMRAVDAEEERQWDSQTMRQGETPAVEDLQRIYGALETSLTEVTGLIKSAQGTLCVDDYGDALAGALRRLELCVRCVRDLRGVQDDETFRQSDNELEAVREWHRAESEACITELLHGVPDQGGNVNRYYLSQLIKMAFLSGAVEQLTRPFVRQPKTGGPDAA